MVLLEGVLHRIWQQALLLQRHCARHGGGRIRLHVKSGHSQTYIYLLFSITQVYILTFLCEFSRKPLFTSLFPISHAGFTGSTVFTHTLNDPSNKGTLLRILKPQTPFQLNNYKEHINLITPVPVWNVNNLEKWQTILQLPWSPVQPNMLLVLKPGHCLVLAERYSTAPVCVAGKPLTCETWPPAFHLLGTFSVSCWFRTRWTCFWHPIHITFRINTAVCVLSVFVWQSTC